MSEGVSCESFLVEYESVKEKANVVPTARDRQADRQTGKTGV